jgi:glucosamine 6-phosphate synthetase-like amidotransferase/phosphosugar isomerase protein
MCGIVAYFGGAGNSLTRVLTGMSAIIYRAPDSTGVAMLGDDSRPVRTKKAVGSVERLVETLLDNGTYPNDEARLISLWTGGVKDEMIRAQQRRLLVFEGLSVDLFDKIANAQPSYPSYDDLVELEPDRAVLMSPGQPGRPSLDVYFHISSKRDFRRLIVRFITEYDLPPEVIRKIIQKPLTAVIAKKRAEGLVEVGEEDIMNAFDSVYRNILVDIPVKKTELDRHRPRSFVKPVARKSLWRCLSETIIKIPTDYVRDGVCCLFRLLDAALLTRIASQPAIVESLEKILKYSWPLHERPESVTWRSLYRAEKGVNVYGRAAAAALTCLKRDEFLAAMLTDLTRREMMTEPAILPNQTDPVSLRYFSQPVIGHGRWALQSAVTEKNAHPFTDAKRHRCVAVNGQFNAQIEERLKAFLDKVGHFSFRSDNSSEYLPLLWGYYFEQLTEAKRRYGAVAAQVDNDLEAYGIGSRTIDFSIHRATKDKSLQALDEMAFIEAAEQISQNGGQVAACGMSIFSPGKLYIVSHNRPAFIVRRPENNDFMVVSDLNAAMGLFPQKLIFKKRNALEGLKTRHAEAVAGLKLEGAGIDKMNTLNTLFKKEKASILKAFTVEVHTLEGEKIFARIETTIAECQASRHVVITDFKGEPLPEIDAFFAVLHPAQVKQHLGRSFYETHLNEIPQRLKEISRNYAPAENQVPNFHIKKKFLRRKFGPNLRDLKRIVLVGAGSAYHMGHMAERFIHAFMPEMDVLTIRPGEIDHPETFFVPDNDLAILLSWSSTTADMVLLARKLLALKVVMVGITEKVFADMALIVAKSGGVIPILSGEEVTVAGVKSTVCMLFCLDLFLLWVGSAIGRKEEALLYVKSMHRIPYQLSNLLSDEYVKDFSKAVARDYSKAGAGIIISALFTDGMGREVALKLEENTWSAVAKALDYQEVIETGLPAHSGETLVLVDATCLSRLDEALAVMDFLSRQHIPFIAIAIAWQEETRIKHLSGDRCVFLPDIKKKALQSFTTLLFYYQLTFYCGHTRGIGIGVVPRNLAKSMTVGRSLFGKKDSSAKALMKIKDRNERHKAIAISKQRIEKISLWEKDARTERSAFFYKDLRRLVGKIAANHSPGDICRDFDENTKRLAHHLFDENSDIEEIVFAPMDKRSAAAVKSAAGIWSRFLDFPVRIISPEAHLAAFGENILLITAAASSAGQKRLAQRLETAACSVFRLEPETDFTACRFANGDGGRFLLTDRFRHARSDYLGAMLHLVFINTWHHALPDKAKVISEHLKRLAETVLDLLDNPVLKSQVSQSMAINRHYKTMFYIGPPVGTGFAWADAFDRTGGILMVPHLFGESVHGPLVTVDSKLEEKFIKLDDRKTMVSVFGETQMDLLESKYLGGEKIDAFLKASRDDLPHEENTPFFTEGSWYIPELLPDYDTGRDNLLVMDATHPRYFDQALDEISTFGCRYPRMILITQQAFLDKKGKASLYRYPVCSTIILPTIAGEPIPEMHLSFVMNMIGTEMAACV